VTYKTCPLVTINDYGPLVTQAITRQPGGCQGDNPFLPWCEESNRGRTLDALAGETRLLPPDTCRRDTTGEHEETRSPQNPFEEEQPAIDRAEYPG
jgi:hypothetical protein